MEEIDEPRLGAGVLTPGDTALSRGTVTQGRALTWPNDLQDVTWGATHYKKIIDQMVKLRMNYLEFFVHTGIWPALGRHGVIPSSYRGMSYHLRKRAASGNLPLGDLGCHPLKKITTRW